MLQVLDEPDFSGGVLLLTSTSEHPVFALYISYHRAKVEAAGGGLRDEGIVRGVTIFRGNRTVCVASVVVVYRIVGGGEVRRGDGTFFLRALAR